MRLLTSLKNETHAERLVGYLKTHKIECDWEQVQNKDWGDDHYGESENNIWIEEEDDFENAYKILEEFLEHPNDPKYEVITPLTGPTPPTPPQKIMKGTSSSKILPQTKPIGTVTLYLLLTCVWIFIWSTMTMPEVTAQKSPLPGMATDAPPIMKMLLFDYPTAYSMTDQLVKKYGLSSLQDPKTLPEEGQALFVQTLSTPIWRGIYPHLVTLLKGNSINWENEPPLFEKIREGEVWRLFTPCLLHGQIFHILFNMLWLAVLGKQMEAHMKLTPYIVFILATGIFSNLSQYLISGPNFIGFSGVLCAMITYVWTRQRRAPWEGYQMQKNTMGLITVFILGLSALQLVSFLSEIFYDFSFASYIANTAHLSGALIGWVFARTPFFYKS